MANKKLFNWSKALSVDCSKMSAKQAEALYIRAEEDGVEVHEIIPRNEWGHYGDIDDTQLSDLVDMFVIVLSEMTRHVQNCEEYKKTKEAWAKKALENELKKANKMRFKTIAVLLKIDLRSDVLIQREVKKYAVTLRDLGYKVTKA